MVKRKANLIVPVKILETATKTLAVATDVSFGILNHDTNHKQNGRFPHVIGF